VPFPAASPADAKAPSLSPVERRAFRELARRLTDRLSTAGGEDVAADATATRPQADTAAASDPTLADLAEAAKSASDHPPSQDIPEEFDQLLFTPELPHESTQEQTSILDRLPVGVLVYRLEHLLYANRAFLDWTGHADLTALTDAGGLSGLLIEPTGSAAEVESPSFAVSSERGNKAAAQLLTVQWGDEDAHALVLLLSAGGGPAAEVAAAQAQVESRELTEWKKVEEELIAAKRLAEKASSAKSDFLAKISHEIRTPLNAIIGFSELMMEERFGPVGNERYRQYLKDIHASGSHLISLINDLLDLSKIEAGKLELAFGGVQLNDLTQQCVAIMQPQANHERIIIRTALSPKLPQVVADARSVRQIVLNLLSNSIKFTGAGGQVIVSTALADLGQVVLRVRDTGVGMSEKEIATALEPFRQLATSTRFGSGGTGLGLPLTKALAEANRANFHINSKPNTGTLVEVTFPSTRVLAE
jgi:signal transduction histidine kinase